MSLLTPKKGPVNVTAALAMLPTSQKELERAAEAWDQDITVTIQYKNKYQRTVVKKVAIEQVESNLVGILLVDKIKTLIK